MCEATIFQVKQTSFWDGVENTRISQNPFQDSLFELFLGFSLNPTWILDPWAFSDEAELAVCYWTQLNILHWISFIIYYQREDKKWCQPRRPNLAKETSANFSIAQEGGGDKCFDW